MFWHVSLLSLCLLESMSPCTRLLYSGPNRQTAEPLIHNHSQSKWAAADILPVIVSVGAATSHETDASGSVLLVAACEAGCGVVTGQVTAWRKSTCADSILRMSLLRLAALSSHFARQPLRVAECVNRWARKIHLDALLNYSGRSYSSSVDVLCPAICLSWRGMRRMFMCALARK